MGRAFFCAVHVALALACFAGLIYAVQTVSHSDEPLFEICGIFLFGGMALAIWTRSRWALLPGCLLILFFLLAAGVVAAGGFIWPERVQNTAIMITLGMALFEAAALVSTFLRRQPGENKGTSLRSE